ncbi:acetyl-CoA carboxylase biotin carboxyl carrier protein [Novispirillum sp. DQ9]|uniref:acetyl-CoA carboxylase biotin carboxyl carrier protein n=1 Tax=Novispirillum sp. DQ9 TaxID=3398612 RepID=UPI003C79D9B1
MPKTSIDADAIRQLASLLDETGLNEIEYDTGSFRVRLSRGAAVVHAAPAPAAAAPAAGVAAAVAPAASGDHPGAVKAPMVGVTYLSPEPGAAPFVQTGQTVSEGQTLMLIEAMKTFNPVRAPRSGKLTAMLVTDGQPVEFGEPLAIIE